MTSDPQGGECGAVSGQRERKGMRLHTDLGSGVIERGRGQTQAVCLESWEYRDERSDI